MAQQSPYGQQAPYSQQDTYGRTTMLPSQPQPSHLDFQGMPHDEMRTTIPSQRQPQQSNLVVNRDMLPGNGADEWNPDKYELGAKWFPSKTDNGAQRNGPGVNSARRTQRAPSPSSEDGEEMEMDDMGQDATASRAQTPYGMDGEKDEEKDDLEDSPVDRGNGNSERVAVGDLRSPIDGSAGAAAAGVEATGPPKGPPMFDVPDGGLVAWLQVVGGFGLFFNTWGISNTFGIFQTYYESGALLHSSPSSIAWVGSLQGFFLLVFGVFSGPLYDLGYLRYLMLVGSFLTVFGYMMLSLSTELWQVILSQGVCVGIGGACLFIPGVAILPTYFRKRLGLAVGLAASGSSMGGVIYPIVFYKLIDRIGFGWTTRVIGFIALATLIPPILFMKQRIKPQKARKIIDKTAFTDIPFLLFIFGTFLGFIGLYVILFYLSYFTSASGILGDKMSFYIVPILNAASVFGRTLPNAISDYTGPLNLITPGALACSILVFCMIAVKSAAGVIVIAVLFGFFSGVFIALPPVCFAVLTKDKSTLGSRIGMGFGIVSLAVLCGGPGTGGVIGDNASDLHFTHAWIYGGVTLLGSAIILAGLRMMRAGGKLMVKA